MHARRGAALAELFSITWPDEAGAANTTTGICRNSPARGHCVCRSSSIRIWNRGSRWRPSVEGAARGFMQHLRRRRTLGSLMSPVSISAGQRHQGACGLRQHFKIFRRQTRNPGREQWRPELVTEYNVLPVCRRAVRPLRYFVTGIESGAFERGLPLRWSRCGYDTASLYPPSALLSRAAVSQLTTGIHHFSDAHDLGAGCEPEFLLRQPWG